MRSNPADNKQPKGQACSSHSGKKMNNAAATTNEVVTVDRQPVAAQPKYDDLVTDEQLIAFDEAAGPVDESELEDIRKRRW